MILNLKKFNEYVEYAHFKMESLQNILDLISRDCYMCLLDLSDTYLTAPIGSRYFRYLKFKLNGKYYCYIVLPFGISSAPRKFTKLLKPIVSYLRQLCIVIVIYIDDLWITATSYQACLNSMKTTAECLTSVGFLINYKKSHPQPSKQVKALGYCLDSHTMLISLPPEKERDVLQHCNELYNAVWAKIRYVARVIGKLISCFPVLPLGRCYYRCLERDKSSNLNRNGFKFDKKMKLSWQSKKELLWWMNNLPNCAAPIDRGPVSAVLFVDSSNYGWGCYFPPFFTGGFFDDLEYAQTINTKETLAIWLGILSFLPYLTNHHLLIRSDSTTAVSYIF